ncbi:hypothetical protein TSAR_014177 [Trichomalopsis sarcophagae]|uniref:Uncharacterized protein n=1 Tax=Trichomalopsis sarcophagae TaxID=543379 RepID=A0A232F0A2_9HYME|nr:hypothetical protein TSAR_014177 [Trichomalopsis sarcophagae]
MWSRCFFFIGIGAFFLAVASAQGGLREENSDTVVRAKPYAKILKGIFGSLFASAAAGCLTEAIEECKDLYKKPKQAYECGKDFLAKNKGKCALSG